MIVSILQGSTPIGSYEKLLVQECGYEPLGDARIKFDIIYYIIGILYLIFDLEIILLFPYAISFEIMTSFFVFILVQGFFIQLTLGFIYEFSLGVFNLLEA